MLSKVVTHDIELHKKSFQLKRIYTKLVSVKTHLHKTRFSQNAFTQNSFQSKRTYTKLVSVETHLHKIHFQIEVSNFNPLVCAKKPEFSG